MGSLPERRRPRLDLSVYADRGVACSVTAAVRDRAPVFRDVAVAAAAVSVLRERAKLIDVPVYAYCVMPDHVHIVLSASPSCDVLKFVGEFKNLAQREAWRLGVVGAFWQPRFWDHVVRSDESLAAVVQYVFENPVRKELCRSAEEYPFSGSLIGAVLAK